MPPSILILIASSQPDSQCFIAISPPITIINRSSNSISLQSMSRWSLDSDNYDAHVNLRNQLHSQHPSFRHSLDFLPCSPNQLSINHMPLETKYSKVLLNRTYFQEKSGSINMIMADKMDIWQSLGLQENCPTLPDQSSSYSIIIINKITSFPPLIFCHGIGSRQNFGNIVASDSLLS